VSPSDPPAIVGRTATLDHLAAALGAAGRGRGSTVLVRGDAGIGKTAVVAEFGRRARAQGWTVLVGNCIDLLGAGVPYLPMAEALRSLGDTARPGSRLSRGLLSGGADLAGPDPQARLFADVRALLDELSAKAPVLLVLEDLHWADASTLDLFSYLAHSVTGSRVLVLVTYRSDESLPDQPLQRLTTGLLRTRKATAVDLGPLTEDELVALLDRITATRVPTELARTIYERSEGNPFFAEELCAAATRAEPPGEREGGNAPSPRRRELDLPRVLRDVLSQRLARLDPRGQAVLRVAAAAGRDVSYGLLAAVTPLPEAELQEALRAAVDAYLLVPLPEAATFRFRHALLAEAAYLTLLPGERETLHARLAETLAERPNLTTTGLAASEVAHHWAAAGRSSEALAESVRAARGAEAGYGRSEAVRHAERAIALWSQVPDADRVAGMELPALLEWTAELCNLTGNGGRAVELIRRRLDLIDVDAEPVRAAALYERLGSYLLPTGRREEGLAAFSRAVELVPAEPPSAERVRVLAALGNALLLSARYQESRAVCEEAVAVAAEAGDRLWVLRAVDVLGNNLCYLGLLDEGFAMLLDGCERSPERYAPPEVLRPYIQLSDALLMAGRLPEASRIAYEGLMTARRLGCERGAGTVLSSNLAEALLGTGDWERAADVLAAALRTGGMFWSHGPHILQAQLGIWRGEFDTAREHLTAGAQAALEPPSAPTYALLLAELAAWQGRTADAANAVDESLRHAAASNSTLSRPRSCALGLRVEADRGRLARARRDTAGADAARRRAHELIRDARRSARKAAALTPEATAWLAVAEAEFCNVEGQPDPKRWHTAEAAWEALERPYLTAYCQWQFAVASTALGSTGAETTTAARAAHATAVRLGAHPLQREVELLAQRARLDLVGIQRGERAGPPNAFGLTAREDEVLQLLGRGYTNRQIAAELTISVKTASVHVSHILHKLGMSRRLEAAAIAHRISEPTD
jgi:DNA-binding CsgD family transcriptional regulator/tetratricopeptide (TPR) repeat protein